MSPRKPWQPRVESEPEFNPFGNDTSERGALLDTPQINDPDEDSAPLEGSKDLSDEDSLDDVIADEDEKRPRRP